jgi:hypothetical protein
MKTLRSPFPVILLIVLIGLSFACSKDQGNPAISPEKLALTKESIMDEILMEDILDEVMTEIDNFSIYKSSVIEVCPQKTIEYPDSTSFPRIITKDFGDSCVNQWGRVRSGKIIITVYGPWRKEGSLRIVTFDNFYFNGTKVEGVKKIVCEGFTDEGFLKHEIVAEIVLTKANGVVVTRKVEKKRMKISGVDTQDPEDDAWLIKMEVHVKKSTDVEYEVNSIIPLRRQRTCKWFVSGSKKIEINEDTIVIDYGEGECDNLATRSLNDGDPEVFELR